MTARRRPNLREQWEILRSQALCGCGCGERMGLLVEWHHVNERALGGADSVANWAAVRRDCHLRITNGTKATTAGSSKHKIARVKRLAADNKEFVNRVLAIKKRRRRPSRWPKRAFQTKGKP